MSEAASIEAYVRGLPKAELHVHLQGAASVPTVLELARRYPEAGVPTEEQGLRDFYTFTDFAHFIEVYISVNRLVRTADDVLDLVVGLGRDLTDVNVRYAEVTVTPDSHLLMGIEPDALADALTSGRAQVLDAYDIELAWVFDIPGELGVPSGIRTIEWVESHLPEHSVGFGLGGPEEGVPRDMFKDIFRGSYSPSCSPLPWASSTSSPRFSAINSLVGCSTDSGENSVPPPLPPPCSAPT